MFNSIEDFLLNKFLGRLLVQAGVAAASYAASGKLGAQLNVNPAEVTALLAAGVNSLVHLYQHLSGKNAPAALQPAAVAADSNKPA